MAFWSDAYTNLEPKRVYRWVMLLGGIPQYMVKKVTKPSFEVTTAEHKYLNHTFYYPGRVTYEAVSVTLVDPVNPDAAGTMMSILEVSGYNIPELETDLNTISKAKATRALGLVSIKQIDAEGAMVEQFDLINAWVSKVAFGELDYENDALVDVTLDLRYDFAILNPAAKARTVEGLPWGGELEAGP